MRRQVYGMFWFERASLRRRLLDEREDNVLFQTDCQHATSLSPGAASDSPEPT